MKKFLVFILSITWGLPLTLIGFIISIGFLITGHRPHMYNGFIHYKTKKEWLGFNMGLFIFTDNSNYMESCMPHELGHGLQNAVYGIFCIFLVHIPSVIRHWYNRVIGLKNDYYSIWFEAQATKWGKKWVKGVNNEKK